MDGSVNIDMLRQRNVNSKYAINISFFIQNDLRCTVCTVPYLTKNCWRIHSQITSCGRTYNRSYM